MNEQQVQEIIVREASRLFARFGLEKTTMEDIARAAGKGKSTLYYYFRSKEEVFAAVIQQEINGLRQAIQTAVHAEENATEQLKQFFRVRLDYLLQTNDQYTAISEEFLRHYDFIQTLLASYDDWQKEVLELIVASGQQQGVFTHRESSAKLAAALFFALKSFEYPWVTYLDRNPIKANVELLINVLLKGIQG